VEVDACLVERMAEHRNGEVRPHRLAANAAMPA
jgi:hypothetical protein